MCCSPWGRKELDMTGCLKALLSGLNEKKDFPGGTVLKHLAGNVQVMGLSPR